MHKIILILLFVSFGVMGQDLGVVDSDTLKKPKIGLTRISQMGNKLFFRGATDMKKEVVSTNNTYSNPSFINSIALPKVTGLQDSLNKKVDKITGKQLSTNDYTTAEKTKLSGIATGATANSTDAQLRDRTTHTGVQGINTITGLQDSLSNDVKKNASYIAFPSQTSVPGTPTNGFRLYANSVNSLSWKSANGFTQTLDGTSNTGDRVYSFQNANGTIALLESSQTWTGVNSLTNTLLSLNSSNLGNSSLYFGNSYLNSVFTPSLIAKNNTGISFYSSDVTQKARMFDATGNLLLQNGGTFTDAGFRLDVNGTARFTGGVNMATTSGSVGIGTTTPQKKLHIFGSDNEVRMQAGTGGVGNGMLIRFTNYHVNGLVPNATEFNVAGIQGYDYDGTWGGGLSFLTSPSGTTGGANLLQRMTIASNGNVGIGTTSPIGKLDVSGVSTSTDLISFDSNRSISIINTNTTTNNAQGIAFRSFSTNGTLQSGVKLLGVNTARSTTGLTTDLAILTNNNGTITEKMRVIANGNVGIGTTSPTSKLQVVGLPVYADNTAALAGGLTVGAFYRTSTGVLMVVF